MPLTDDDFLKDSKLELYNEVIESLQEQEEKVEEKLDDKKSGLFGFFKKK